MRILIAGGTGELGSAIVTVLQPTGHQVRIMSQKPAPDALDTAIEWATADVSTGNGIAEALAGVDIVVNTLGNFRSAFDVDVMGVKRLADAAKTAGVAHFYHISIIGIDRIEYAFYRHKLDAEQFVIDSSVPYSIQRVSQFHSLIYGMMMRSLKAVDQGYVLPLARDAVFQPIDTGEVAEYALPSILGNPAGRLPDVGGPEILQIEDLAREFLAAHGIKNPTLSDPEGGVFPDSAVSGFRAGANTAPDNRYGQSKWREYVQARQTS